MKQLHYIKKHLPVLALCILSLFVFSSCEDDDYDHKPPAGKGSIIVENSSGEDTDVYINGEFIGRADSGDAAVFDLDPGRYRLVLDETDGYRNYRDDIDVLENRLTIVDVMINYSSSSLYYVTVYFD